jgi:nitrite reductase/ring-hydroxylating ferredoxin subunit
MTCENLCATDSESPKREAIEVPANHVTRRVMLSGLGAVLAGVGLVGPAESAMAAAKTYTVGKTTDVKVGSARMYNVAGIPLLVTQPKKGVFKAFNGYCTHQQVQLDGLNGTNLICSQHGSSFNTTTGKVTGGPARSALANYKVTVAGTTLKVSI